MEQLKPNLDKQKSKEGIEPVALSMKAMAVIGALAAASPAEAQDQPVLHRENPSHTMVLNADSLIKMAQGLAKIAQDPRNKDIAAHAAQEMAPIAIDAAKKIAEPAINELINGLSEFRRANYPEHEQQQN